METNRHSYIHSHFLSHTRTNICRWERERKQRKTPISLMDNFQHLFLLLPFGYLFAVYSWNFVHFSFSSTLFLPFPLFLSAKSVQNLLLFRSLNTISRHKNHRQKQKLCFTSAVNRIENFAICLKIHLLFRTISGDGFKQYSAQRIILSSFFFWQ